MISNIEKPLKVNPTLATLLSELGEECETVLFLRRSLRGISRENSGLLMRIYCWVDWPILIKT
ncbi:MAG: hypothetical protein EWV55_24175 [Microcystis viridis Mv_BB_P_19951000_S69]|uniref:Uncharacterized protein n=2 Tax=Microcystis TaxID=1125 RepID=A0A552I3Y7_MICVR|nr:hypothetical protein GQR42_06365 [Microcystis aeruginosa FD4]TRU68006.1 MAG: hypothetical protein EWV55_24175 [Microcystis viridis Mv_BB_P_19951000_S69]TRU77078.1 MAG: hypothetical protein EWV47_04885 [Microcystis viridis Mv_BB_P_19951000_S68]TRU78184.1 MAG: hypothetical protein EWV77_04610 [Microcystis viridis Mv_BB_P_19951000_S68D]TRU89144.1 MAG: hypothetical protein EWV46_04610 [Microcystis viridis Mv_BB_P_19951000_S69D]